jgi:hypothetical protein
MPATWSDDFQRSHPSRHQRQRDPQVATDLPGSITRNSAGLRPRTSCTQARKRRDGEHASDFLGSWNGKLVCDDFAGYKASFEQGITEIGCMAHARRKFFDLHVANKSLLAEQALHSIGGLYEVERHAKEMSNEDRWRLRQKSAVPIAEKLHEWMLAQRELVPEGSATAQALDYSLKRWVALTRYLEDGAVPIDNNQIENLIRPLAHGRSNCLFAGSLRSGKRAAAIMSLIQSAHHRA